MGILNFQETFGEFPDRLIGGIYPLRNFRRNPWRHHRRKFQRNISSFFRINLWMNAWGNFLKISEAILEKNSVDIFKLILEWFLKDFMMQSLKELLKDYLKQLFNDSKEKFLMEFIQECLKEFRSRYFGKKNTKRTLKGILLEGIFKKTLEIFLISLEKFVQKYSKKCQRKS